MAGSQSDPNLTPLASTTSARIKRMCITHLRLEGANLTCGKGEQKMLQCVPETAKLGAPCSERLLPSYMHL